MQCTETDVNKGYQLIYEFYIPVCLQQETVDRRKAPSVGLNTHFQKVSHCK